jgi:hypothetical protein
MLNKSGEWDIALFLALESIEFFTIEFLSVNPQIFLVLHIHN